MTLAESVYRDLLAYQLGGQREVRLRFGRVDVVASGFVIEVEPLARWRHGMRQALAYGAVSRTPRGGGDRAALAVYGDLNAGITVDMFEEVQGLAALFILRGCTWTRVESARDARGGLHRAGTDTEIRAAISEWRAMHLGVIVPIRKQASP